MEKNQEKRALRVKDAATFLGIAQSTFWRWAQEGKLPKGIRLSTRCTVWKREDLEAFLEQREGRS
ncbi:helix-turn-helix domain-containing protein [Desulfococcaceae bacterium OttesenSCG-928-F15]|nr:helix-turn-helix domain-containing protein [Desulfococcaceae bacterium OttesenSCG-928-F15]